MRICGLQTLSMVDYPANWPPRFYRRVQFALSFLSQCPSGYPAGGVSHSAARRGSRLPQKTPGLLDGVVLSGGEPLIQSGVPEFLQKVRSLGFSIKLDTNGTRPAVLKHLAESGLIQKAAVDIKACPDNYPSLTGMMHPDLTAIQETVSFLLHGNLDYEFRTTVVKELHNENDLYRSAKWLKGAKLLSPGLQRLR